MKYLYLITTLFFFTQIGVAHEWNSLFISIDKNSKTNTFRARVLFDATNTYSQLKDNKDAPAQPREWLFFLSPAEHKMMQEEAKRQLQNLLTFSADDDQSYTANFSFPDWQYSPPKFPKILNGFAYFHVDISLPDAENIKIKTHKNSEKNINLTFEINTGITPRKYLLLNSEESAEISLPHTQTTLNTTPKNSTLEYSWVAFSSGFKHVIPQGIDHILFIILLALSTTSLKEKIGLALVFTLTHSLCFSLVFLGLISLTGISASLVEFLILASIIWMAIELIRKTNRNYQKWIIASIGLIHGLGFGSAMASALPISPLHLVPLILSLNLGIDSAQFLLVTVTSILLYTCKEHQPLVIKWISITAIIITSVLLIKGIL